MSLSALSSGAWEPTIEADLAAEALVPGLMAAGWLLMMTMTRSLTLIDRAAVLGAEAVDAVDAVDAATAKFD